MLCERMVDPRPGHLSGYSSALWGVGFRYWVSEVLSEMRRKSPVQQWVDSLPKPESSEDVPQVEVKPSNTQVSQTDLKNEDSNKESDESPKDEVSEIVNSEHLDKSSVRPRPRGVLLRDRSTNSEGNSPRNRYPLFRDSSFQSDGAGSRCSSVESLLESRKVDAEAVLRGVGFGPSPARQHLARIPDRFLKPSQVKGIDTDQFIKEEQKSMKMHECGIFGYRGLTGHPHVPPSTIVAKIIERISSCDELPETTCYVPTLHHSDIENFY